MPANAPRARISALWAEVEHTWFGVSVEPVRRRLDRANWNADALDAFCWRCGLDVGPFECDANGCAACRERPRPPWDRVVRLGTYTAPLDDLIRDFKFTPWRRIGVELGEMLGTQIARAVEAETRLQTSAGRAAAHGIIVVPVPTTFRRRMTRGIDHTLVVARSAARVLDAQVRPMLRRRHRPSQVGVASSERVANVRGAITARRGASPLGELVVIVDDVVTTGATMAACCRALRAKWRAAGDGASGRGNAADVRTPLWAATIARAQPDRDTPRA